MMTDMVENCSKMGKKSIEIRKNFRKNLIFSWAGDTYLDVGDDIDVALDKLL